jgi:hypothetical protein
MFIAGTRIFFRTFAFYRKQAVDQVEGRNTHKRYDNKVLNHFNSVKTGNQMQEAFLLVW